MDKITRKDLKRYDAVLNVGNGLQYLLSFQKRVGYNSGAFGWNYDLFEVLSGGKTVGIQLGYRIPGKISNVEIIKEYEQKAYEVISNHELSYEEKKVLVNELLQKFVNELMP